MKFVPFCFILYLLTFAPNSIGQTYDILITNARIVDGTGNPWYWGDLGTKKGKIVAIGKLQQGKAKKVINAKGKVVAPGFIDVHGHLEGSLYERPKAENLLYDGVTTMITGNCGGSRVDLDEYFDYLGDGGISINLASLIGHNSVRLAVMGTVNRGPTSAELNQMEKLVEQAMKDGAVGLSTGLIYIPGTFAKTAEIIALAKVVKKYNGVYASHIRNEDHRVFDAIEEAVAIGREAEIPVEISHFKITGKTSWGQSDKMIRQVEGYRNDGIDVTVDQYPYPASSTGLSVLVPSWTLSGGTDSFNIRLNDPTTKAGIVTEMKEMLAKTGFPDYSYSVIANCPWRSELNGKNISEANLMLGREKGVSDEIETIFELVRKGIRVQMVYHKMSEEDVKRIMQYPLSMVARDAGVANFGVGNPHPRAYGSCARVLGHYVREEKVLRLEEAIRKMTSLPAQRFQFHDRGLLLPGKAADIVVFDPGTIKSPATFEKSHVYSKGMEFVIVNGVPVVENGTHNGQKPGEILKINQK